MIFQDILGYSYDSLNNFNVGNYLLIDGCRHSLFAGYYNEHALHYVHFVHSLCLLERLLLYKGGRQLFPLNIPGRGMWRLGGVGGREDVLVWVCEVGVWSVCVGVCVCVCVLVCV